LRGSDSTRLVVAVLLLLLAGTMLLRLEVWGAAAGAPLWKLFRTDPRSKPPREREAIQSTGCSRQSSVAMFVSGALGGVRKLEGERRKRVGEWEKGGKRV
jgi:hypothetical protein